MSSVVVVCDDSRRCSRLIESLPLDVLVIPRGAHDFVMAPDRQNVAAVVVDAGIHSPAVAMALQSLREVLPTVAVLWIGQAGAFPTTASIVVQGAEAVQGTSGGSRLWSAVRIEIVNRLFGDAASRIVNPTHAIMPVAFAAALRADPPLSSVAALARRAGCDRGTLYNQWPELLHCSPARLGLADCLDALLLLRAAAHKRANTGWRHMSREWLGVRPERLHRVARRFDIELCDVADGGFMRLVAAFDERVLAMLRLAPSGRPASMNLSPPLARSTVHGSHQHFAAGA